MWGERRWVVASMVCAGCAGPLPVVVDGGADAGPVITMCERAFEVGAGRPCDFDFGCSEGFDGWCAERAARCDEGATVVEEHAWRLAVPSCPPAEAVALEGSGPSGAFTLDTAIASHSRAFAVNAQLLFSSGAPYSDCSRPHLMVPLQLAAHPTEITYVGSQEVSAILTLEDGIHALTGTVEVSSEERDEEFRIRLIGTLALAGDGLEIAGSFDLIECLDLDRSGP